MLSGFSCVPMTSVEVMPADKRCGGENTCDDVSGQLVLSDCALFSIKGRTSFSNRSLKGSVDRLGVSVVEHTFHLDKISGLSFRKISSSDGKAFPPTGIEPRFESYT